MRKQWRLQWLKTWVIFWMILSNFHVYNVVKSRTLNAVSIIEGLHFTLDVTKHRLVCLTQWQWKQEWFCTEASRTRQTHWRMKPVPNPPAGTVNSPGAVPIIGGECRRCFLKTDLDLISFKFSPLLLLFIPFSEQLVKGNSCEGPLYLYQQE